MSEATFAAGRPGRQVSTCRWPNSCDKTCRRGAPRIVVRVRDAALWFPREEKGCFMAADEEVFAEFCRREHQRLVGALGLYCGDFDLAEELAQEALARVWRDWATVQRKDSPAAWA